MLPHLSSDYSTIVYPIEDIILDSTGFISGKSILSHHLPILYNRYTIYKFRTIYDADLWRNTTCEQTRQILLERYYDINHNPGPLLLGHYEYGCFSNRYGFYSETGEISHLYISTPWEHWFYSSLNGTSNEEIFGGHIRAMLDIIERAPTEIS